MGKNGNFVGNFGNRGMERNHNEIVLYQSDNAVELEVRLENET